MFYGYVQLAEAGHPVDILDEGELGLANRIALPWRLISLLSHALTGVQLWVVWRLARPRVLSRLNAFDILVATTTTFGMSVALLKSLGLVRGRAIFIAMGLGELAALPWRRWVCEYLLRNVEVVAISKGEVHHLRKRMRRNFVVGYMPFGVDDRYWTPAPQRTVGGYVLSVGNDPHRDYATLVETWKPDDPPLKIVTRLTVPAPKPNVEVISGDWRRQLLSDAEMRRLFRRALFVVLPICRTIQPSGQGACLQAMACGKAVVISDIEGLWDRDLMVDGETCVLVPPESPKALRAAIHDLLADPEKVRAIGARARQAVEQHFNVSVMAAEMERLIGSGPHGVAAMPGSGPDRGTAAREGNPAC